MGLIKVSSISPTCDTNVQGTALRKEMVAALRRNDVVRVSFAEIGNATSSYVNSAFVELLGLMSFSDIKRRIRVVDASAQIRDMIKHRLTFEAQRGSVAA
jgi:hypothetical protein